ncbi:MAG TPA: pinensin family lanthipeptide [Longimicrobium sp.]|nr:pinensin family lanthipeptide [Longimicrobium sp.]
MKKLTLDLDDLRVESFATDADPAERGTVHGNSLPTRPLCSRYCPPSTGCPGETETCTLDVCC